MHRHEVQIYYEDTDLSGVVYHANYLRYFERAREHLLGVDELVRLLDEDGIGFVVYKAALTYKEGARLGDTVEVRTTVRKESKYRLAFSQNVYRIRQANGDTQEKSKKRATLLVEGRVDLVCVNDAGLCALPEGVLQSLEHFLETSSNT